MMLAQWLFFPSSNSLEVESILKSRLQESGYAFYDPFPGGAGTPVGLQQRIRSFLSPPHNNWVRLLFAPNEQWPEETTHDVLSGLPVIRAAYVSAEQFEIGTIVAGMSGLAPFLRAGLTEADLEKATAATPAPSAVTNTPDLPPELQKFAQEQGVDAQHVDKFVQKMAGSVFKKMGSEQTAQAQAKSAMAGAAKQPEVEWSSPAGQALQRVMACLSVPEKWWQPDWKTISAAYQTARQVQRDPKSLMLPGDKQALAALPNALEFTPLYMGKNNR